MGNSGHSTRMGPLIIYMGQVFEFAVRGSVQMTDKLSIMLGPLVTAALALSGYTMGESLSGVISIGIAITVFAVILLRLLMAPYFIWKRQNGIIESLEEELARPEQIERKWLAEHIANIRGELVESLAIVGAIARETYVWRMKTPTPGVVKKMDDFSLHAAKAESRLEQLSYIPDLRTMGLEFLQLCYILMDQSKKGEDTRQTLVELQMSQSKLFPLLHHR